MSRAISITTVIETITITIMTLFCRIHKIKTNYVAYQYQTLQHSSTKLSMFDRQSIMKCCSSFFKTLTAKRIDTLKTEKNASSLESEHHQCTQNSQL